jgi:hypothetical protein
MISSLYYYEISFWFALFDCVLKLYYYY